MLTSARILMARAIDYAGLFPPAKLAMSDAFDEYLSSREDAHGWLLGRFVCPVGRLAELEPLLGRLGRDDQMIYTSVLGSGGDTPAIFARMLGRDIDVMTRMTAAHRDRLAIDQFEVRLPPDVEPDCLTDVVSETMDALASLTPVPPLPFFECSLLEGWRERIRPSVQAIAAASGPGRALGFKIRCGGTTASAVPTVAAVVAAISACRTAAIPLKATQGLHHPIRHFDFQLETMTHGFLNLFICGAIAHSLEAPEDRLLEVLEEEDPTAFTFAEESITWRGDRLDLQRIAAGRRHALTTFGSCSFAEPRDDLLALGLLDPAPTEQQENRQT